MPFNDKMKRFTGALKGQFGEAAKPDGAVWGNVEGTGISGLRHARREEELNDSLWPQDETPHHRA